MKTTYHGSCHCGKVRFEADFDLQETGTGKCNCSICTKLRFWSVTIKPEQFRLLSDESELSDYRFGSEQCHHVFCKTCGTHSFGRGYVEEIGGAFYSVRVNCLDDIDPSELAGAPVRYMDGRNNNWRSPPAETRYL
jgi:hypothetical protein